MRDKVGAEQLQQVHHCTTQTADHIVVPKVSGRRRRAADGQQPVSVTTGECSETVADYAADSGIDGH
jgi:hypothetical protein